jgi:uncharacterized protein (DUF1330 family)
MPAYVIVNVDVKNPVEYEGYKKLTPGSLTNYQGKFIARGGKTEVLEGDWEPKRVVILEFPTYELAKAWWASAEYADAKVIRQQNASTQLIVTEGI